MKLDGKTALVTGGASGIGRATVMELARSGASVICADVNAEKGAQLQREAAATNFTVELVVIDLADPGSVRRCIAEVLERHPRIDILVNAAGWNDIQPFMDNPPDYMDRVIAINLSGMLHVTQALLPAIIAAGKGKIVNVSSDAGRVGSSGETTYAAAKGGVIAFTKSLAREVARHSINVNCVCPGPTDTPMLQSRPEKLKEAFLRAIPFHRFAKPQEIADAILFFASPRSDYITGQVLSVSGGLTFAG
ncbi:MAG TPA: SDR family NAD(P)-dependent oxidoreductase [Xanthobacteraceae bacterium]|jgi:2-hydroxycyclohexanecarboxyl-CoA dehydrogenase